MTGYYIDLSKLNLNENANKKLVLANLQVMFMHNTDSGDIDGSCLDDMLNNTFIHLKNKIFMKEERTSTKSCLYIFNLGELKNQKIPLISRKKR